VVSLISIYYFINITKKELNLISAALAIIGVADKKMDTNNQTSGAPKSAVIKTNYGEIEITFRDKAPIAVANFIKLSRDGFYDGTKFHRVIEGFMIQGGDPFSRDSSRKDVWGTGGPGYQFQDEFYPDDEMKQGVLAMANAGPGTNGSQFFIVTSVSGAQWLVGKHTVFGKVTRGMDTVLKIEKVQTEGKGVYDRPVKDVVIDGVTVR